MGLTIREPVTYLRNTRLVFKCRETNDRGIQQYVTGNRSAPRRLFYIYWPVQAPLPRRRYAFNVYTFPRRLVLQTMPFDGPKMLFYTVRNMNIFISFRQCLLDGFVESGVNRRCRCYIVIIVFAKRFFHIFLCVVHHVEIL